MARRTRLNSTAGSTLLELVIGFGLGSLTLACAMSFMAHVDQVHSATKLMNTRDTLLMLIRQSLMQSKLVQKSATFNADLDRCINGTGGGFNCQNGTSYDFTLHDHAGQQLSGPNEASPLYYDLAGVPCGLTKTKPDCLIKVSTVFKPYCRMFDRNAADACIKAEYLEFYFVVDADPNPTTGLAPFTKTFGVTYFNQADRGP